MIVFNCSQAFAEFIEPRKAGPAPFVGAPASKHPGEDAPRLIDADGQPPRHVEQWLVHGLRIRRKTCVLVMDIDTRYAMLFSDLRRGDPEGFLNAFATRLMNEMALAASEIGMLADFEAMLTAFLGRHERFQFVKRSERSTLAHLTQAAWVVEDYAADVGHLPQTHEECAAIDAHINETPRRAKDRPGWFYAQQEMLCAWLRAYGGLTAAGEASVRARMQAQRRAHRHPPQPAATD